jgi:hypothetical protein
VRIFVDRWEGRIILSVHGTEASLDSERRGGICYALFKAAHEMVEEAEGASVNATPAGAAALPPRARFLGIAAKSLRRRVAPITQDQMVIESAMATIARLNQVTLADFLR